MIHLSVLFEDSDLLVVDKPFGIVVNRAASVKGETVQDWAEEKIHSKQCAIHTEEDQLFVDRAGIVHRIDKETSGCLLIAKNTHSFIALQRQFKERIVKKTYLALSHGRLVPEQGEIRAPVGRLPWNRERFGILPGGKEAVTAYSVLGVMPLPGGALGADHGHKKQKRAHELLSIVELRPVTGRTHQIRVHLKYIQHPIVGDWQYGGRKTARSDRMWAHRVLLHAWRICFLHPDSGRELAIEAPIPDDMNRIFPPDIRDRIMISKI